MAGPSGQDLEVLIGFGVFAIAGLYYWRRNLPSNWTLDEQTKYGKTRDGCCCGLCPC